MNEFKGFIENFEKSTNNSKKPNKPTFIIKPEGSCQGKGIFLSRNFDEIMEFCTEEGMVV
jgi:predicted ATP-grasp superfamily ATP-dependent carboligase